jgi:predicted ArsR family transcriptional regulator
MCYRALASVEGTMPVTRWDDRFFETTKGRILALLRRGGKTVEELAGAMGLSDNAIRPHLSALERDGIVRQRGTRPTGGKPATVYEVAPEAERLFTKAYIPVLTQLVAVLAERSTPAELEALLREVGTRLAAGRGPSSGSLRARAEAAATVLTELGGVVDLTEADDRIALRGYSCPLADAVRAHPATCQAAESLVAEIVGAPVRERCERSGRPRCCFEIAWDGR